MDSVRKKIVVQEPQFLPWSGLWHKVLECDKYVISTGVKVNIRDVVHRVMLPTGWITLPLAGNQKNHLIRDIVLADNCRKQIKHIVNVIKLSCMSRKNPYGARLSPLIVQLEQIKEGAFLVDVTTDLTVMLAAILGVPFPYVIGTDDRPTLDKIGRLRDTILTHADNAPVTYLSGSGGRNYMGFTSFPDADIEVWFQMPIRDISPFSIVPLIANVYDPVAEITACATWERRPKAS